jgi:hypothetical protein
LNADLIFPRNETDIDQQKALELQTIQNPEGGCE